MRYACRDGAFPRSHEVRAVTVRGSHLWFTTGNGVSDREWNSIRHPIVMLGVEKRS